MDKYKRVVTNLGAGFEKETYTRLGSVTGYNCTDDTPIKLCFFDDEVTAVLSAGVEIGGMKTIKQGMRVVWAIDTAGLVIPLLGEDGEQTGQTFTLADLFAMVTSVHRWRAEQMDQDLTRAAE